MKPSTRIPLRLFTATSSPLASSARRSTCAAAAAAAAFNARASISTTPLKPAEVAPVVGTGPPPEPPIADIAAEDRAAAARIRVERRKKQAEMLKHAKRIRTSAEAKASAPGALKRRFWNDVSVQEVDGALQVHLDSRPLRHPNTKEIIRLPPSKQHLASALAIEWDFITSAEQATKQHLIPLTSLICRAIDIAADDAAEGKIREHVANTLMRYLDTDAVLCWAPPAGATDTRNDAGESLRDVQKRSADAVVGALTGRYRAAEAGGGGEEVVQGWVMGLDAWELTGLERAVLAGKSLLGAARLVVEWSEGPVGEYRDKSGKGGKFGVEEAATALSLEVTWQTGAWGEVEDTHDVEKEDLRRQLGSVVLLVSGTNRK
ncbi:ATP synthase mitochondrial F1 complex assembly factor 2 [Colletotrichum fioriniae]|uniref:ATP synthase mitochondrial F1 complex assembly factor 2 n=1 Tax=Colletotrichum fioriniae TaxID=710243 RepID=UPI0032DA2124|nr:ATP synthase mitochondrial F1 complex assembly factor 2 [Colletotrichum fioriniae]